MKSIKEVSCQSGPLNNIMTSGAKNLEIREGVEVYTQKKPSLSTKKRRK